MPGSQPIVVVETASPSHLQLLEALAWSLVVRALLRFTSMHRTTAILNHLPRRRRRGPVSIPTEPHFGRAGACLGRQLARSHYLRQRCVPSTILIGVQPFEGIALDAHAWMDRLDQGVEHQVLFQMDR